MVAESWLRACKCDTEENDVGDNERWWRRGRSACSSDRLSDGPMAMSTQGQRFSEEETRR